MLQKDLREVLEKLNREKEVDVKYERYKISKSKSQCHQMCRALHLEIC